MIILLKRVINNQACIINSIDMDLIGLLDVQYPFIWLDIKVRELIDCVFKGYPVKNCLFWDNGISNLSQQYEPSELYKKNLEELLKNIYWFYKPIGLQYQKMYYICKPITET